ncbi:hypothetical protein B566_EDAN016203 [Ephemera danica]|nr:hypothetical protein B566_EDAN016203 [Ephemera danica]
MSAGTFGQIVIGPPGSGKSTYCQAMANYLRGIGRKVAIINLDPANDNLGYEASANINQLITQEDVMTSLHLGPNGALVYCMEFLEKNFEWLLEHVSRLRDHYLLFDLPGQVELYTHHKSVKNLIEQMQKLGLHLCCVHLVDSHNCSDPGKFISALLLSLSTMLHIELPHLNVLSKVDLAARYSGKLDFGLDFYTEVLDLNYLLDRLDSERGTSKLRKLNAALVGLVEDYSLVSFLPLAVNDTQTLVKLQAAADKANGWVFGGSEPRNIQALLACATGAEFEHERVGEIRDKYGGV